MAETLERLEVEIDANTSELKRDLNKARSEFSGFRNDIKSKSSGITESLSKIGKVAASAFAVKELIQFGKECINLASDLQEVQNVVDVTFGGMSDQVDEFAKTAMEKFGLSEKAAKQFTGTMGAMLQSSGLNTQQALEMSTNLTALSADLASFYNLSNEDAFTKIRSGISGETEPLKQLGINMSVANMEAYALSEGITKSYDSMTQAEQAILRYNYLISTTSAQQGDFARTSDSWANQTKVLSMRFDKLKSSIGTGLIELFTPVLEVINGVVQGLTWIVDGVGDLLGLGGEDVSIGPSVVDTDANVSSVAKDLGVASTNAKGVADGINSAKKAASELKRTVSGFDDANVLSDSASGIANTGALDGITKSAGNMGTALKNAYDNLTDMNSAAGKVKDSFDGVQLSASQIDTTVGFLVKDDGSLAKMAEMTQHVDKMDKLADNINTAKKTIEGYNWMVSMGIELSKEDEAGYKKAVDDYCKNVQDYVQEQHKAVSIATELVFGAGSKESVEVNSFYTRIEGQLSSLSKQIKDKVNEAWKDGVLSFNEAKEITNLMNQEQRIINAMNDAEFTVKFNKIKADASGADLDYDSFIKLEKSAKDRIEEYRKNYEKGAERYEIYLQTRVNLGEINQDTMDKELKEYKDKMQLELSKHSQGFIQFEIQAAINLTNSDYDFSAIKTTLENGMKEAFSENELDQILSSGFEGKNMWKSTMSALFTSLSNGISNSSLSEEAKQSINHILETIKPTEKEWQALANDYEKKGQTVPTYISAGLSSINLLKAMTGDIDAIYWLMGNQMKGTEYEKTIKKAKEAGLDVPEKLLDGLKDPTAKIDLSKGVDSAINTLSEKIDSNKSATTSAKNKGKEVEKNLGLGIKAGSEAAKIAAEKGKKAAEAFGNKANNAVAKSGAAGIASKFVAGIQSCDAAAIAKKKGEEAAKSIVNGVKTMDSKKNKSALVTSTANVLDGVTSGARSKLQLSGGKSKLFGTYADYTVAGYNKQISNAKTIQTSKKAVEKWIGEGVIGPAASALIIKSPSRLFGKFGDYTTQGYNNHILANIGDSKKVMAKWGSDIARWGNDYLVNDFGNVASASISGNITTDITGSLANAVKTAMDSQKNTFFAEVNIGGEKHVVQFVKTYNQMHSSNPNFGFAV